MDTKNWLSLPAFLLFIVTKMISYFKYLEKMQEQQLIGLDEVLQIFLTIKCGNGKDPPIKKHLVLPLISNRKALTWKSSGMNLLRFHIFPWEPIHVYAVPVYINGNEAMRFERLRFSSFYNSNSAALHPEMFRIWLANAGYYYNAARHRVLCYWCGNEFSIGHNQTCGWAVDNEPFQMSPQQPTLFQHLHGNMADEMNISLRHNLAQDVDEAVQGGRQNPPTVSSVQEDEDIAVIPSSQEAGDSPADDFNDDVPAPQHQGTNPPHPPQLAAGITHCHEASAAARREEPNQLELSHVVYPQFSARQSRHNTFCNCQLGQTFPPEMLVDLGFFYDGYADCVRCFYCGIGLKSWSTSDDPLAEHIRWSPNCGFLLRTIHTGFDNQAGATQRSLPQAQQPRQRNPEAHEVSAMSSEGGRSAGLRNRGEELLALLGNNNNELRRGKRCQICRTNDINTVFLPCGHFLCCHQCALGFCRCPMCSKDITATEQT